MWDKINQSFYDLSVKVSWQQKLSVWECCAHCSMCLVFRDAMMPSGSSRPAGLSSSLRVCHCKYLGKWYLIVNKADPLPAIDSRVGTSDIQVLRLRVLLVNPFILQSLFSTILLWLKMIVVVAHFRSVRCFARLPASLIAFWEQSWIYYPVDSQLQLSPVFGRGFDSLGVRSAAVKSRSRFLCGFEVLENYE